MAHKTNGRMTDNWWLETIASAITQDGNGNGTLTVSSSGETPYATKVTVVGQVTYIGEAPAGTAQSAAAWRARKVDETSGTIITWADGNTNFDNVATDLTVLSYS